jgi:hypothetical protein
LLKLFKQKLTLIGLKPKAKYQMKNIFRLLILVSFSGFAQKNDSDIGDQEINITKDRKIVLPPANRILEKIPSQSAITIPERSFNYNFNDYKPDGIKESKFTPTILNPETGGNKKTADETYTSLIRLGAGNYGRIFGETYLNSDPESPLRFGLHYLHNSNSIGPKDDFLSSRMNTGGNLYANYFAEAFKLTADVAFQQDRINYYGYPLDLKPYIETTLSKSQQRKERDKLIGQRLNRYQFGIGIDNVIPDSKFDYKLNTALRYFSSNQFSKSQNSSNSPEGKFFPFLRENDWFSHLEAYFPIIDKSFVAKVEGEASILQIRDDYDLLKTQKYNRNLYKIFPSFTYNNDVISATVGFRGVNQYEGLTATAYSKGYPVANFTYKTGGGINVFVGLDGDFNRNTLWALTQENPFLYNNTEVKNTEKPLEVYIGSKGEIIGGINYNVKASYNQYKNLFFYNNNSVISEKFDLVYEPEKSTVYTFNGEANYPFSEMYKTGINLNYNYYDLKTLEKPFHRPAFTAKWNNSLYFSDKLLATSTFFFQSNVYAKNPISTDIKKLPAIFDLNFELDYFFGKQFSGFIKLNNVFNKKYEQYQFYPKQGFNFLCGLNYIF